MGMTRTAFFVDQNNANTARACPPGGAHHPFFWNAILLIRIIQNGRPGTNRLPAREVELVPFGWFYH
jgi:hypothetical protein